VKRIAEFREGSQKLFPVLREISDLLFVCHFASQNNEIKIGNYFFDVCCVN